MPWQRLANVCSRALRLAEGEHSPRLAARLSLLSETLVANKPQLAFFKQDQSLGECIRLILDTPLALCGVSVAIAAAFEFILISYDR